MTPLDADMIENAARIERFLDAYLRNADAAALAGTPDRLLAAMRHGALDGGKRLRPFLLRTVAEMYEVPEERIIRAGAALEMVHSYSLIHDDLPDMDDDRLRRGKPSVWAAFDPATAILAGDALLSEAFRLLTDPLTAPDPEVRIGLVRSLARRSGASGMVGGQMLDLVAEATSPPLEAVTEIQQMKTGELVAAAMEIGALLGGETRLGPLTLCGHHAGLAFQIADDILDATASSEALGKTAGKDAVQQKATIVAAIGLDGARRMLEASIADALTLLDDFGPRADRLREVIRYFAARQR
ncbi:MAG TPA: polyprenyl synthetase family protein [Alphaproteobacteria bacterium]|nr:polyprenyl synthetase family protein [Alphaproteobacteria bacterium]